MKIKLCFVLALVLGLAACGNKGPLVMPQTPVPVESDAPPAKPEADAQPAELEPTTGTEPEATPDPTPEASPDDSKAPPTGTTQPN